MKISQLIATKKYTQYHESVASRLPRKITSQQQLLNIGYGIAVRDLGLSKAKTLDENFAANLVNAYHKQCLDEGLGSFLGKAAGHVAGAVGAAGRGIKGAWQDAKQGYATAKSVWDPKDAPGTYPNAAGVAPTGTPPAAQPGTAQPGAAGTPGAAGAAGTPGAAGAAGTPGADGTAGAAGAAGAPTASGATGDIGSIMQTIDKLDKPTKQQLAGELEKNIASAPEPAAPAAEPAATTPASTPATATATPGPAGTTYDPAKAAADKLAKGQADQQLAQQQMDATKQANAAAAGQDAAIKAAADAAKAKPPFQQTASDKLAIKAAADKGIREAKEKKKKAKKKIVAEFNSNFLGRTI